MKNKPLFLINNDLEQIALKKSLKEKIIKLGPGIAIGIIVGSVFVLIFYSYYNSLRVKEITVENKKYKIALEAINNKLSQIESIIQNLNYKDDSVYGALLNKEPVSKEIKTYYAHLLKFNVKKGELVNRGQTIGFVGGTGQSAGVHLHYEVHVNKKEVDPVNYFFRDLTPEQYEKIILIAKNAGFGLD